MLVHELVKLILTVDENITSIDHQLVIALNTLFFTATDMHVSTRACWSIRIGEVVGQWSVMTIIMIFIANAIHGSSA